MASVLGEPSYYRQYRILTSPSYYSPVRYKVNPYSNYRYEDACCTDNIVYVTDQYGRTTIQSAQKYRGFYWKINAVININENIGQTHSVNAYHPLTTKWAS